VNSPTTISGASNDNSGLNSSINHTLVNSDVAAHNVSYTITPKVYGQCNLSSISAEIWVNPTPQIQVSPAEQAICYGETATITVNNLNTTIRGQWLYDLVVTADPEISGNKSGGSYTDPVNLTETLINTGTEKHKVIYRFIPRIAPEDNGSACIGPERFATIWVHPRAHYTTELSDFNGYNISCYGKSTGYINIDPSPDLAPYSFDWSGPDGFNASTEDISGLKAGQYDLTLTDVNNCTTTENFDLIQPSKLSMAIESSVSIDGNYNISCFGSQTGYVNLSSVNNVGEVDYLWGDGFLGSNRPNMKAGNYKIIISDSNNCQADSMVTLTQPEPIQITFETTDPFCPEKSDGEIISDAAGGIPGNSFTYKWSDGSTDKVITNIPAGQYRVAVTDINGCLVKDSVKLNGMNKICLIIPEAISPNKDLINDVWNIENIDLYPQVEITIFNRWGQSLWKSETGYPTPWDGRSRDEELPIDSYHYVIDLHNGSRPIIGSVTIIR